MALYSGMAERASSILLRKTTDSPYEEEWHIWCRYGVREGTVRLATRPNKQTHINKTRKLYRADDQTLKKRLSCTILRACERCGSGDWRLGCYDRLGAGAAPYQAHIADLEWQAPRQFPDAGEPRPHVIIR